MTDSAEHEAYALCASCANAVANDDSSALDVVGADTVSAFLGSVGLLAVDEQFEPMSFASCDCCGCSLMSQSVAYAFSSVN